MKHFPTSLIIICLGISILLQVVWGNLSLSWFAFPVNIALLGLLTGVGYVLQQEKGSHPGFRAWTSSRTSIGLIGLTFVASMFIALRPQWGVQQSWPFVTLLLLLLSHLWLVILRYRGPMRRRFLFNHVGLFIFIVGLMFGAPDMQRLKTVLSQGETAEYALDCHGIPHALGYPLKLERLDASFYDNGTPQSYKVRVSVGDERHDILVNYPWHKSWKEDLYITSYGLVQRTHQPYCVIEIITQPWKYLIYLGLLMTVAGAVLLFWGKKHLTDRL